MKKLHPLILTGLYLSVVCAAPVFALDVQRDIIQKARQYVGCAYQTGGTKPVSFDCSGFVGYVMRPFVPDIPRVSKDMSAMGKQVRREELSPGDLVFFATTGTPGLVSHVALYIGQDSIIHAISDGPDRGVNITSLNARYWREHYHSAKRVLQAPEGTAKTGDTPIAFAKGSYTGELAGGEPHGTGKLALNNGDLYMGAFVRGRIEGIGTYVWKNGDRYEGEFRDNAPDGKGFLTPAGGKARPVVFRRGELFDGSARKDEKAAVTDKSASKATKPNKPSEPVASTPAKQAESAKASRYQTFLEREDSAWETWDGNVMGDYEIWKAAQNGEFRDFNERYDGTSEADKFEEWKKKDAR